MSSIAHGQGAFRIPLFILNLWHTECLCNPTRGPEWNGLSRTYKKWKKTVKCSSSSLPSPVALLWNASRPETRSGSCHGSCLHISPHLQSTDTGLPVSSSEALCFLFWFHGWAPWGTGHIHPESALGWRSSGVKLSVGSAGLCLGLFSPEGTDDPSEGDSVWQVGEGDTEGPGPCCCLGNSVWKSHLPSPALPPTARLLESTVGLKIPDLHTVLLPQSCRVHVGIFKFSMKIWASCSSPQDALSHQPSHVPLRSWEMDYFTQAFANDGSNLNLQVGVDGRNSPASVSISSTPPPPASAPHLSSSQKFFCLLWVSVFPNIQ